MLNVEGTIHGGIEDFSPVPATVVFSYFEREIASHSYWGSTDGQSSTIDINVVVEKEKT